MKRLLSLAAVVLSVVISSTAFASPRSIPRPDHSAKVTHGTTNLKKLPKNARAKAMPKKQLKRVNSRRVLRAPRLVKH